MRRKVGAMLMLVERSRWDPCYLWKEKSCTSHHAAPPPSPAALLSTDSPLLYSQSSAAGPDLPACPSKACPREAKRMDGFHLAKVLGSNWGGDRSPSYSCFSPQEHAAHADCLWASSCRLQPNTGQRHEHRQSHITRRTKGEKTASLSLCCDLQCKPLGVWLPCIVHKDQWKEAWC